MNRDKVYLKGYVVGHAADKLGYQGLMVQLENLDIVEIDKNLVHKEIDGPQKITVPQFVAGWLNYCKLTGADLYHALEMGDLYFYNYANQKDYSKLKGYFETEENQELFARAWLDGYEVEKEKKEKRYLVKTKGLGIDETYLKFQSDSKYWYMGIMEEYQHAKAKHTRKELEEAGFGEVFNSPLFEVEEVTE